MAKYDGKQSYGPFGKLLEVCAQVGWHIEPPCLRDHDGVQMHLARVDIKLLEAQAVDAWRQSIAFTFAQRKDVHGLCGIDWRALDKVFRNLPKYQKETLHVLQDGTFMDGKMHSKYDNTKTGKCGFCQRDDTFAHRCEACPAYQEVRNRHAEVCQHWDEYPTSLTLRLLPSRNPFEQTYRINQSLEESKQIGLQCLASRQQLDLFTDGSCKNPTIPWASAGAWAIVSATHDCVVARGVLGGLEQTSDRAELQAIAVAIDYAVLNRGVTTIWSDNAYATEGVAHLLQSGECPFDKYENLWDRIHTSLQGHQDRIFVQHVTSHRLSLRLSMDVDDWTAYWNGRADHEAEVAHSLRSYEVERVRQSMIAHHNMTVEILMQFVNFHLDIAEYHANMDNVDVLEVEEIMDSEEPEGLDGRRLCLAHVPWQRDLPDFGSEDMRWLALCQRFSLDFTRGMLHWLREETSLQDVVTYKMSLIEIAVSLCSGFRGIQLPQPDPDRRLCWVDVQTLPAAHVSRPTIASILKLVQNFFGAIEQIFDFDLHWTDRLDLSSLGVTRPSKGLPLLLGGGTVKTMEQHLIACTYRRPIRKAGDLSRPIR
jgi:ribonuclease HI